VAVSSDDDAVVLTWTPAGIDVRPAGRLLYLPAPLSDAEESTDVFAPGEALEFRAKDHQAAARLFQDLTGSPSPDVRAGALLRLARALRKSGGHDQALKAYADLTLLPGVRLAGLPADLVARRARCVVFYELARKADLEREAGSLRADLAAARWPIDRGAFIAYSDEVDQWIGPAPGDAEREALSAAAEWIWQQRRLIDVESGRDRKLNIDVSEWTIGQSEASAATPAASPCHPTASR
jgi:hypothetical protein